MVPTMTKDGAEHPGHDGIMNQPQANIDNDIPPQSQINSKTKAGETRQKSTESTEATKARGDSATISLPLSLIKGIRHKSKDNGNDSSGSNSGGSGNNSDNGNSDNSGLISIGVNSFGFNFNAEESLNGSPPNSEKNAESSGSDNDSGGKNQAKLAVVSSEASSLTTKMKGSVRTIRENTGAMRKEHGSSNHQQKRKAASMSLTSRRSSSGSGSDSGSGDGSSGSGDGSSGSGSNGANSRSSKKSTVSSLTNTSNSSSKSNQNTFTAGSHEDAAAAAVANLQSIANAYRASSNGSPSTSSPPNKSQKSGLKRKARGDNGDGNDSGGYNSDDEGAEGSKQLFKSSHTAVSEATSSGVTSAPTSGTASTLSPPHSSSITSSQYQSYSRDPGLGGSSCNASVSSDGDNGKKGKKLDEGKREERNAREKERSFRISRQINELRALLSVGGVIVPKGTKSSVLTEAANYIRMLQQHQYRSEIDRHQLVQQMQMIGSGALGPQAASAVRHVAAQNGVWSLGNFGGVPPRSAMSYYPQGATPSLPGSADSSQASKPEADQTPPMVNNIEEHEYRFVFNSCSVGMAIASMGGAFIDCNNLFCQLSEFSKQEVCSMTIFNLTSREDLQNAFDLISQMISPPVDGGNTPHPMSTRPCVLRGAMKNREDLGLSVELIKGDDGIAKCFCVALIMNPDSPFDMTKPVAATADMVLQKRSPDKGEEQIKSGNLSSPTYTAG